MESWVSSAEQILLFCRDKQKKSIVFVSPTAGSGVSTCVRAVAGVAAQSGFHPIVIDLSQAPSPEMQGKIHSGSNPIQSIVPDASPFDIIELNILSGEKYLFNNSDWLRARIDQLLGNYDFALIDVPAILDRDQRSINPISVIAVCECTMLVCEPGKVTSAALEASLEQIRVAGARVDGIVLNQGRVATTGQQIARLVRKFLGFAPSVAASIERRILSSTLLD